MLEGRFQATDRLWVAEINEDPLDEKKQRGGYPEPAGMEGGGQPHRLCFADSKLARERGSLRVGKREGLGRSGWKAVGTEKPEAG